jgi:hypothetical protein
MATYLTFIILQILDLLTTLWFTHFGLREGNPVVMWLTSFTSSFTTGVILIKLWAIAMGWIAWRTHNTLFFRLTNAFFALVVLWNIFWILFLRVW